MKRAGWFIAGLVVAGLAVFAWYALGQAGPEDPTSTSEAALGEAEVVETDLRQTTSYEATLGRVTGDPIVNRLNGTVTWLPAEGSVIEQGGVLLEVDGSPVVLLYGDRPAWRAMRRNVEGADVMQLETALADLGFDPKEHGEDDRVDEDGHGGVDHRPEPPQRGPLELAPELSEREVQQQLVRQRPRRGSQGHDGGQ